MDEQNELKVEQNEEMPQAIVPPKHGGRIKWGTTIVSLIIIAAAVTASVYLYQHKDDDLETAEDTNQNTSEEIPVVIQNPVSSSEIDDSVTENNSNSNDQNQADPQVSEESTTDTSAQGVVMPDDEAIAGSSTISASWVTKEQKSLGFQYILKSTWSEKVENSRVTVYDPVSGSILATIEVLGQEGATMDLIQKQLQNSLTASNIQLKNLNGQNFLHYNVSGSKGYGYATIKNNRVYYIVDYSSGNQVVDHFKTI